MKSKIVGLFVFMMLSHVYSQEVASFTLDSSIKMDGIYKDADTLYFAEGWDGSRIFKIYPDGEVTTFAEGLDGPIAILRRADGNFYVSEWNASRLSIVSPSGDVAIYATVPAGPGPMTMDDSETIYVTHNINDGSGVISTVDLTGTVSTLAESGPLINPGGIDFGSDGNLYVANFNDANIIRIELVDTTLSVIATIPSGGFWKTGHLAAGENVLYVSGISSHIIYAVDLDGTVLAYAGSGEEGYVDGALESCQFSSPNGLTFDPMNARLYITRAFSAADYVQFIDVGFAKISEKDKPEITPSIYPNPTDGRLIFDLSSLHNVTIDLFDMSGQHVESYQPENEPVFEIDMTHGAGIFLVKIIAKEAVYTQRVVVE